MCRKYLLVPILSWYIDIIFFIFCQVRNAEIKGQEKGNMYCALGDLTIIKKISELKIRVMKTAASLGVLFIM